MRDGLSNKLEPGQLLYWVDKGLIAKVIRIDEPMLTTGATVDVSLTLEIQILGTVERGKEFQVPKMLRLVDPASDALLDKIAGGRPQ